MATIGLDKLYYAIITEGTGGVETYGAPKVLAKAISAELAPQIAEATLYADDGAAENVKEFTSATFTLGVDDLASDVMADLLGATVDQNGVVVSTPDDAARVATLPIDWNHVNARLTELRSLSQVFLNSALS